MITIDPGNYYRDDVGARSLFVDSVTGADTIKARIIVRDGNKKTEEVQVLRSGSKLSAVDKVIDSIEFFNDQSVSISVDYHSSQLFTYDEARAVGDVNAIVDKKNNTLIDNNEYESGGFVSGNAGLYSYVCLKNKSTSGKNIFVREVGFNAKGNEVRFFQESEANVTGLGLLNFAWSKVLDGSFDLNFEVLGGVIASTFGSFFATFLSSNTNYPTVKDYRESPLMIKPGRVLIVRTFLTGIDLFADFDFFTEDTA